MLFKFRFKKNYKEKDILGGIDNYSSQKLVQNLFLFVFS